MNLLILIGAVAALALAIVLNVFKWIKDRRLDRKAQEDLRKRVALTDELIERLTVFRFSCGAKAVKLGAREADLVSFGCSYSKIEPLREGDVLLYCTGTCNEFGCCPLKKIVADPMWFAIALKALSEPVGKPEAGDSHGLLGYVRHDDPCVPALARVCLRLGIKGFLLENYGKLGFWCPPSGQPFCE